MSVDSPEQQGIDLLEEALLWIMDLRFGQNWMFKVTMPKWQMDTFVTSNLSLHETLIDALESCGLLVDYRDVFSLDFHSDGTHSLHSIHWWANDVVLNFSKSVLMKKHTQLH